jgi:hypothetical protein
LKLAFWDLIQLYHNYLVDQFTASNPEWTPYMYYQEARRMTIAFMQNLVMRYTFNSISFFYFIFISIFYFIFILFHETLYFLFLIILSMESFFNLFFLLTFVREYLASTVGIPLKEYEGYNASVHAGIDHSYSM